MSGLAAAGPPVSLAPAGDSAWLLRFPPEISEEGFLAVMGALARLEAARTPEILDLLPGYASLLVVFDPRRLDLEAARAQIEAALARPAPPPASDAGHRVVEIPVHYHPDVAPDLEALAAEKGLAIAALVARHTAPLYRCHLLGFRPGFPFLGGLDPALHTPRLATPRLQVPPGSVGVAGRQTGVYPGRGPGGWRLIGRTPLTLFDPQREPPFLIAPGDRVRFLAIDARRFDELAGERGPGV